MSTEAFSNTLNPKWWYLHGKAYDFSPFASRHPGGAQAINLGKGRDCTALFESYHTWLPGNTILEKYAIKDDDEDDNDNNDDNDSVTKPLFTFEENGFYRTLKRRTGEYFQSNGYKNTKGGISAILSGFLNIFCLLFSLYMSFIRGSAIFALIYGVSKSLLVIRSTHACSHYSFSTSSILNRFIYWFNMCCVGDTPAQWTAKHVLAHHIDTNVVPYDDDTMYPVKRVLPCFEREWWHSYQHIYIWFFYSFLYYPWTLSHNIKFIIGTFKGEIYEGSVIVRLENIVDWLETVSCIVIHHIMRILPFIFLPTWWQAFFISFLAEWSSRYCVLLCFFRVFWSVVFSFVLIFLIFFFFCCVVLYTVFFFVSCSVFGCCGTRFLHCFGVCVAV